MRRAERVVEGGIFNSRWMMARFYVELMISWLRWVVFGFRAFRDRARYSAPRSEPSCARGMLQGERLARRQALRVLSRASARLDHCDTVNRLQLPGVWRF